MRTGTSALWLTLLGTLTVVQSVRAALLEPTLLDLLLRVAVSVGIVGWCVLDAGSRHLRMPGVVPVAMVFLWPLAVPIYLVWSRGWGRGALAAAAFVVALVLCGGLPGALALWMTREL